MNRSSKKSGLNFDAHGINCSDTRCVLPVCVNWKLSTRHVNSPQVDKQDRHTADTSLRSVSQQRSGDCKESLSLNQSVLAHDAEEQLRKDLEHFERVFQSQRDEFQSTFLESLGITQPNANALHGHTGQEDWNNVGSQQVPQVPDYDPILDMGMNIASQFPENAEQIYEKGSTFKASPHSSISDPIEDSQLFSYFEQFVQMNPYVVASEEKENKTAKRTKRDHHHHYDVTGKIPTAGSNAIKETSSLEDNKEQLCRLPFKEKCTNKLFGILSEILRMFESPMSADLEAFYVQILQKALKDIQNPVRLNVYPNDMKLQRGFNYHSLPSE